MKSELEIFYHLLVVPIRSIWKVFSFLILALLSTIIIFYCLTFNHLVDLDIFSANQKDIAKILNFKPQMNTIILDKNQNVISEQFNKYHLFVPYKELPPKLIHSIIAIEDRKFFEHNGIDVFAIMRAAVDYFKNDRRGFHQGASTITQQIVKNLLLTKEKTIERKIREIMLSLYIEQTLSKEKILEIYCNHIFLGNGSYGVGAAAKRYFNKNVSELDYHETALIAGLFQSPGKYNPMNSPELAKQRQLLVLNSLVETKKISLQQLSQLSEKSLDYQEYETLFGKVAPYYVDYIVESATDILSQKGIDLKDTGLKIFTTLDPSLQKLAENTLLESEDVFKKLDDNIIKDKEDYDQNEYSSQAAMVALDKNTGEIVALIGGRDYQHSQYNRAVHAIRPPGSVFKPITYALALKNGHKWNDQHYISPVTVGNYRPRTSQGKLFTETTLLEAFYESINSPAVEIGNQLGIKKVVTFGRLLGIETPQKYEAASLLGSSEVSILDMARVYNTFANDGVRIKTHAITKIEDRNGNIIYKAPEISERSKRIIDTATNQLLVEGLKQVVERGTGYHAKYLSSYVAGKTGTSNLSKDNWFCGFTNDLVIVTWLGNDNQHPYKGNISASNTATPLWARFAAKTKKYLNTAQLSTPTEVKVANVHPRLGHLDDNGIPMYFLAELLPEKKHSDLLFLERGQSTRMDFDDF